MRLVRQLRHIKYLLGNRLVDPPRTVRVKQAVAHILMWRGLGASRVLPRENRAGRLQSRQRHQAIKPYSRRVRECQGRTRSWPGCGRVPSGSGEDGEGASRVQAAAASEGATVSGGGLLTRADAARLQAVCRPFAPDFDAVDCARTAPAQETCSWPVRGDARHCRHHGRAECGVAAVGGPPGSLSLVMGGDQAQPHSKLRCAHAGRSCVSSTAQRDGDAAAAARGRSWPQGRRAGNSVRATCKIIASSKQPSRSQ
ncbi:hypothetical protein OPT61_g6813 [Boeremia exigua]|uniref:Uncharacterized protein n=1 Tax=Boeremia exigua TaxID=749465 RepID=A0ACC2I4V0_9PLEO|nr:hypothetical protein OPT61_g6813 [Boeremia exigua]